MLIGWRVVCPRRRSCWFAALVATIAVVALAAPDNAHAFAWKDQCVFTVVNDTHTVSELRPDTGLLAEIPPNPLDEVTWSNASLVHAIPKALGLYTIGFPVTFGCAISPIFSWYGKKVSCIAYAPSSGINVFRCSPTFPQVSVTILTDDNDIKGVVTFGSLSSPSARDSLSSPAANPLGGVQASAGAALSPPDGTKRVSPLLRRRDLPGRGWRAVHSVGQFGWLGQLYAADNLPASCEDPHKSSEPIPRDGGASVFGRGPGLVGYEHGVYGNARQARRTLGSAVSSHGIGCLAQLLTSARFHTRVKIARYSLPAVRGATLWRLIVRTPVGDRTRVDYLDVAGLLHHSANALVLFTNVNKPPGIVVEQSAIRSVASRLP